MPDWKTRYPGVETLNVAVMGCIVNGPGESKHADIGISLPGTGEQPAAPVFIDGRKAVTLRGADARRPTSRPWSATISSAATASVPIRRRWQNRPRYRCAPRGNNAKGSPSVRCSIPR